MSLYDEYLKQQGETSSSLPQAQTVAPSSQDTSGGSLYDQYLQSQGEAEGGLPQAQPFTGEFEGQYSDSYQTIPKPDTEGGFLKMLLSQPIGLGQGLAERFSPGLKRNMAGVEQAQNEQVKSATELFMRRGLIQQPEQFNDENAEDIYQRILSSKLDDRQKSVMVGILNDSFNTQLLPEPKTNKQLLGDLLGTLMFVAPVGVLGAGIRGAGLAATAGRGAVIGGAFGSTLGMSENEDISGIIKQAAIGAALGAPLHVGGALLGRGIKAGITKIANSEHPVAQAFLYNTRFIHSVGARLQRDFGQEGKNIYDMLIRSGENTRLKTGGRVAAMQKAGLFDLDDRAAYRLTLMLEGHIPVDKELAPVYKAFDQIRKEIAKEAGKSVEGFTPRQNFFRHYVPDPKKLAQGPIRENAIQNAVANGTFKTTKEATDALDSYLRLMLGGARKNDAWEKWLVKTGQATDIDAARAKTLRMNEAGPHSGSLQNQREIDFPFYDTDSRRVITAYISEATSFLEEKAVLGTKLENLDSQVGKYVAKAQEEWGAQAGADRAKELRNILDIVTGQIERTPSQLRVSAFLRTLQTPKLAFAQVLNVGQNVNTLLASDAGSFFKGLGYAFSNKGYTRALETGATLDSVMRSANMQITGTSFGSQFLKYIGFTATEKFNRVVAANVGIKYAEKQAQKLVKNPQSKIIQARLQELGLNPQGILARGGKLTEKELLIAGQRMSNKTQFLYNPLDLPAFSQSPTGAVVFQYKSFIFQQTTFLKNQLKMQIKNGNYGGFARDLIVLGTIFPMTGEVVADIRSLISGTQRKTQAFDRYIEDIMTVGGFGLYGDVITSAGWSRVLDWAAGPTAGTISEGVERIHSLVTKRELKDTDIRYLLNQTGFGRALANYMFPRSRKDQETFLETLQNES